MKCLSIEPQAKSGYLEQNLGFLNFEEVWRLILAEDVCTSLCEFLHDCRTLGLITQSDLAREVVGTCGKTLAVACADINVRLDEVSGLWICCRFKVVCPQKFGNTLEEVAVGQMNTGAQTATVA